MIRFADILGVPNVGPDLAFNEFKLVQFHQRASRFIVHGYGARGLKSFGIEELYDVGAVAHDQAGAVIWHSEDIGKPNHIARIDPQNGKLLGWIDLGNISPDDQNGDGKEENTLNGIAYDEASDRLFVTGKNWKKLYEIKVRPK